MPHSHPNINPNTYSDPNSNSDPNAHADIHLSDRKKLWGNMLSRRFHLRKWRVHVRKILLHARSSPADATTDRNTRTYRHAARADMSTEQGLRGPMLSRRFLLQKWRMSDGIVLLRPRANGSAQSRSHGHHKPHLWRLSWVRGSKWIMCICQSRRPETHWFGSIHRKEQLRMRRIGNQLWLAIRKYKNNVRKLLLRMRHRIGLPMDVPRRQVDDITRFKMPVRRMELRGPRFQRTSLHQQRRAGKHKLHSSPHIGRNTLHRLLGVRPEQTCSSLRA